MEQKLWDILPKLYEYKITYFELDDSDNFDTTFKVNIFNGNEVKRWLKQFELCSLTNFRVARTAPAKQTRVLFKKYYRCHHNTRASETASKTKKAHVKHTGCEATLLITVNNSSMRRCKQPDLKRYPCIVKYHNFHNHPLTSDEHLCHRKPSEHIEQKIRDLLLKNHTPVSALKILKQDLQEEFKDEYSKISKDGAFCPKLQWVYHKYYSIFKKICAEPYNLECLIPDFLIEEFDTNDIEQATEQSVCDERRSESSSLILKKDDDITYDEYISSSEEKSLFEDDFVEVYTLGENDLNDSQTIFVSENCIGDIPIISDEIDITDSYMIGTEMLAQGYENLSIGKEEVVNTMKQSSEKESMVLWNNEKQIGIDEDDLQDIFGEACDDIKLSAEIFLPSVKDEEIRDYEKNET